MYRIGNGYDVHKLISGRKLILGGIEISHDKGLLGHSDADALLHSITDAIIGALALGDIGKFFPDTDVNFKDIDSKILLKKTVDMMKEKKYSCVNLDCIIVIERPKLRNYIDDMRKCIANLLETDIDNISIKAKTEEKLGFVGREEGVKTYAIILLKKEA